MSTVAVIAGAWVLISVVFCAVVGLWIRWANRSVAFDDLDRERLGEGATLIELYPTTGRDVQAVRKDGAA